MGWRIYLAEPSGANMPSTAIRNTQYDPGTRTLSVWFTPSGNRYDYADVAPATYAAFMKASSKGRFFNEFIRDRYSYRRVA
ncbi:KTSC domain-containing protein [Mesorhizobium loti]